MSRAQTEEDLDWPAPPQNVETAAERKAREGARALLAVWMHANRARRQAEQALSAHQLSFPLWWVLFVTEELIRESSDAVSQRDVVHRTSLGKATVSYLMGVLARRSLVDRGPEFGGICDRIWLTQEGESLLARASQSLELVMRGLFQDESNEIQQLRR